MEQFAQYGIWGMFLASFLAATIMPMSSEPLLVFLVYKGFNLEVTVMVATCGNFLGGLLNFYIGRMGKLEWITRYLNIPQEKLLSFRERIVRFGPVLAFFTWVPLIGDPLGVALGYFRAPQMPVLLFMAIGKALRYIVFSYFTYRFLSI